MTDQTAIDRIPIGRNVTYAVRGVPEVQDEYNAERTIAPIEISLTYRAAPDSQLGRVHAYVKGWWMQDGQRVPMDKPVGRHFYGRTFDEWPDWLVAEARLHDPDAAVSSAGEAVWVDGDPLMEAIAAAVWEHCDTSGGYSIVTDDPRNIAAVAATVARAQNAAGRAPAADRAALRESLAAAVRSITVVGGAPPRCLVPVIDGSNPRMARIVDWQPLDDFLNAVVAVLPAPADRAAEAPAATCSAQNHNYESGPRQCIRAAQHRSDHIDEHGFHWSDTVAVYPVADGTFRKAIDVRAALRRVAAEPATTRHTDGETQQSEPKPDTPRCTHCAHPKGDHSDRKDHTPSRIVPRRPWCHACNATCDYDDQAAAGGAQQQPKEPRP